MRRRAVEAALDAAVREHRFTVAVVFPLAGAALLVASAESLLPAALSFNPSLVLFGTLVMRLPLIAGLAPLVDRRSGIALAGLAAYAYAIEAVGLATGWPYGEFAYGVDLGPMVGGIPVALPVFFLPLVINAYLLALLMVGDRPLRLPVALALVLAVDLVLDPAAVALGFWTYSGGAYYGVPLSNYAGWVLSGTVGVLVVDRAFDRAGLARRLAGCEFALDDLVSFVLLWGAVNAVYWNAVPVLVAAGIALGLAQSDRFDVAFVRGRAADRS